VLFVFLVCLGGICVMFLFEFVLMGQSSNKIITELWRVSGSARPKVVWMREMPLSDSLSLCFFCRVLGSQVNGKKESQREHGHDAFQNLVVIFLLAAARVNPGRNALQSAEQGCQGRCGRVHQLNYT